MDQYPTEILIVPTATVAVVSDSAQVADSFATLLRGRNSTAQKSTTARLRFETFPITYQFPDTRHSHTNDYETRAVSGVLKTTWLNKHHNRLPATVVLVLRVPETCPDWPAAEAGIVAAVAQIRHATSHGAELLVVIGGVSAGPGRQVQWPNRVSVRSCYLSPPFTLMQ